MAVQIKEMKKSLFETFIWVFVGFIVNLTFQYFEIKTLQDKLA